MTSSPPIDTVSSTEQASTESVVNNHSTPLESPASLNSNEVKSNTQDDPIPKKDILMTESSAPQSPATTTSNDSNPISILSPADIESGLRKFLNSSSYATFTRRTARELLEKNLGLPEGALLGQKRDVNAVLDRLILAFDSQTVPEPNKASLDDSNQNNNCSSSSSAIKHEQSKTFTNQSEESLHQSSANQKSKKRNLSSVGGNGGDNYNSTSKSPRFENSDSESSQQERKNGKKDAMKQKASTSVKKRRTDESDSRDSSTDSETSNSDECSNSDDDDDEDSDDSNYGKKRNNKKTTKAAAKPKAQFKKLQAKLMTKARFSENAEAIPTVMGKLEFQIEPRVFSTGSCGWYYGGKVPINVGEKMVTCQLSINCTVVGSKEWKNGSSQKK